MPGHAGARDSDLFLPAFCRSSASRLASVPIASIASTVRLNEHHWRKYDAACTYYSDPPVMHMRDIAIERDLQRAHRVRQMLSRNHAVHGMPDAPAVCIDHAAL